MTHLAGLRSLARLIVRCAWFAEGVIVGDMLGPLFGKHARGLYAWAPLFQRKLRDYLAWHEAQLGAEP